MNPVAAATPAASPGPIEQAPVAVEGKLFDFVAEAQRQGGGEAARLANPAHLLAEMAKGLNGYVERARMFAGETPAFLRRSAGGPEPDRRAGEGDATGSEAGGARGRGSTIGDADLDRAAAALMATMRFSIDTALVVRGTAQISGSANTLLKGQ
jgi:hypothetical protein